MLLVAIVAVILLVLAVDNAYEFATVYRARGKDKANMMAAHSRVMEAGELFGFVFAGVLLYISALDMLVIIVLIVVGLYHLGETLTIKQYFSVLSRKTKKISHGSDDYVFRGSSYSRLYRHMDGKQRLDKPVRTRRPNIEAHTHQISS